MKKNDSFDEGVISITSGVGSASTPLAAFDTALYSAGIANFNLIHLSSVIPAGYIPKVQAVNLLKKEYYGDRLYVVYASRTEECVGHEAWAGLGWVTAKDEPRRGLFVEHVGTSKQEVQFLLESSLTHMIKTRKEQYGPIQSKVEGIRYEDKPVCALVVAIYKRESW